MENAEKEIYFDSRSLAKFVAAQGKTIEKIVCHLWQNSIEKDRPVEIIDNIVLCFTDRNKLTISSNENANGLAAIEYDYRQASQEIEKEFNGKIKIFSVNASGTEMWGPVIG